MQGGLWRRQHGLRAYRHAKLTIELPSPCRAVLVGQIEVGLSHVLVLERPVIALRRAHLGDALRIETYVCVLGVLLVLLWVGSASKSAISQDTC